MDQIVAPRLRRARAAGGRTAGALRGELLTLLRATTMPADVAGRLTSGAPALWLTSNTPGVLATDLALCHPPLAPEEVRARGVPFADGSAWRLTVVAHDRRGLLADVAAALAGQGYPIMAASVATWSTMGIALLSLKLSGPLPATAELAAVGEQLRLREHGQHPEPRFQPRGGARVGVDRDGDASIVVVSAVDQVGLLWAVCDWFSRHGLTIEAAAVGGEDATADDVFVVSGGDVDATSLARRL